MNSKSKNCIRSAFVVGLIAGVAGCIQLKVTVIPPKPPVIDCGCGGGVSQNPRPEVDPPEPGPAGLSRVVRDPSGNSGSVNVPIGSLLANTASTGCFQTANNWDRYFPIRNLFCGPSTPPIAFCFTNANNKQYLTVQTCNPTNGTTLRTGIVLANDDDPSDKRCVTNSASCIYGTRLTINNRAMANDTYYRATIFFKSSTLGSLTNVVVDWRYE